MPDGLIDIIDALDADALRKKLLDFFGGFGYLNVGGSNWYEQHGMSGLKTAVVGIGAIDTVVVVVAAGMVDFSTLEANTDKSSPAAIIDVDAMAASAGTSSDFKFKLFISKSNVSDSFASVLSFDMNFFELTTFWRFVGMGGAVDVEAITSHSTLPFLRCPSDTFVDFSFLPYDMDALLVVVWRSLFSLHTSVVSDELHAVDCFSNFDFVWDVVAYICVNINQKSKPS